MTKDSKWILGDEEPELRFIDEVIVQTEEDIILPDRFTFKSRTSNKIYSAIIDADGEYEVTTEGTGLTWYTKEEIVEQLSNDIWEIIPDEDEDLDDDLDMYDETD